MALRFPPPPDLGRDNQKLNRWLLEIQSILNSSGLINTSSVQGLPATIITVGDNTVDIANLTNALNATNLNVAANTANIATNTADIATNTAGIAANTSSIAALTLRSRVLNGNGVPAVGLGSSGDLYINNTGGAGTRLYGKITGAWVAIA